MRASAVLALGMLAPADALAFCQQTTRDQDTCMEDPGSPIAWRTHCMSYSLNEAGSDDLPFDVVAAAIRRSMDAWEAPDCTDFEFQETDVATCDRVEYRHDCGNVNVVVFRESGWVNVHGHDPAAIALSTIYFTSESAKIVSTDMELNGEGYRFADDAKYVGCGEPEADCPMDLQNTVTHEAGHFIGLAHVVDGVSTMDIAEVAGDIDKRTLEADDIAAICSIYPDGQGSCSPDPPGGLDLACAACDTGCCTAVPGVPRGGAVGAIGLVIAMFVVWRVRR